MKFGIVHSQFPLIVFEPLDLIVIRSAEEGVI